MGATRRGFIGTILGATGLVLPHNIGKIVEPTKREIAQVMEEKPKGVAVVSGQVIIAEEILYVHEQIEVGDLWPHNVDWHIEAVFLNDFGERETLTIRPKQDHVLPAWLGVQGP